MSGRGYHFFRFVLQKENPAPTGEKEGWLMPVLGSDSLLNYNCLLDRCQPLNHLGPSDV